MNDTTVRHSWVMTLPLWARDEVLYRCPLTRVFRRQLPGGETVICKELLGPNAVLRFQHEKGILERLSGIDGVPRLVDGPVPSCTIAMEDNGALPLDQVAAHGGFALPALLHLMCQITSILADIHDAGVAHKNISPDNILYTAASSSVTLIDFSLATTFAEERPVFVHHREIAGNLPYLAPEQTGRTGRAVDQRADLYALGATCYFLVTGRPPFQGSDTVQLIHDILTTRPVPPIQVNRGLREGISRIIMRLLEKEPDRRYQSAAGVRHDLSRLLAILNAGGSTVFPLGERDFTLRLSPPSRLVGRHAEMATLTAVLEGVVAGGGAGVLVSGAPGIGKTALINELRHAVAEEGGWFVSGSFDEQRRDPGASATVKALTALGRLILAEPEEDLLLLRQSLLHTVGSGAGLIAASIAEFATIVGVAPEPAAGDPVQAQARFYCAWLDVLACIGAKRPVLIFLDDLQWCAQHALNLVNTLLSCGLPKGILLVASYRDAEIDASHRLAAALKRWERLGAVAAGLRLENLSCAEITILTGEMLRLDHDCAASLAREVWRRSGGNPRDTVEILNALRRVGLLRLGSDGWEWSEEEVRRHLESARELESAPLDLASLPPRSARCLTMAAVLGRECRLSALANAAGVELPELVTLLAPPLKENLLVLEQRGVPAGDAKVSFPSDRVRQKVYEAIPPEEGKRLHLDAARRLAAASVHSTLLGAEQYLQALDYLTDREEAHRVFHFLRDAACTARGRGSHDTAERFLAAALRLAPVALPPPRVQCATEKEWHSALYSLGRYAEAERVYRSFAEKAAEPEDLVDVACIQIRSQIGSGRLREAVTLGVQLLVRWGVAVPPGLDEAEAEALHSWYRFAADFSPTAEVRRDEVEHPHMLAVARLLHHVTVPACFCDPPVGAWLALESQRLWREWGPCGHLFSSFGALPFVTIPLAGDYAGCARTMESALSVGEARGYRTETSLVLHTFALFASHWVHPLEESIPLAQQARHAFVRDGDTQHACYSYKTTLSSLLECAPTLQEVTDELDTALSFTLRTGNDGSAAYFETYGRFVLTLREGSVSPGGFAAPSFDEEAHLGQLKSAPRREGIYHTLRALAAVLLGDAAALNRHAEEAQRLLPAIGGLYATALAHLVYALSLASRLREGAGRRQGLLEALTAEGEWLAARGADAPHNFRHLELLVRAERAAAAGERVEGARLFDQALLAAREVARPWHRALITERCALFYLDCGLAGAGRTFLAESRDLYRAWGAAAKVRQLERAHPFLRACALEGMERNRPVSVSSDSVDLLAILRASQALSSETSVERLKARVVQHLGELAGAGAVQLLVRSEEEESWLLLDTTGSNAAPLRLEGDAAARLLPLSALRYAQRTRQPLLVENALHDERFYADPYLAGVEHCSLMLVPVLNQGTLRAMLILENRLTSGAFNCDRLDAVQLLAGQLAVSLENALLYEKLEERVQERTRELQEAQSKLVATARQAGMAEVATNVLHNVGNVLNTVNVSAGLLGEYLRDSKAAGLTKAVRLIESRTGDLGTFFTADDKGKRLPVYLSKLACALETERRLILEELDRLTGSVDHIKAIVATQQSYAGACGVKEPVAVAELLDDALRINAEALQRHRVAVVRELAELPVLELDRGRVLQIMVNLVSNAVHALERTPEEARRLVLFLAPVRDGQLTIRVADAGEGITRENLSRIFTHGFTTRKDGHGFGLHSCALAAKEMGGTLTATSEGTGRGALFTLQLPVQEMHR